MAWIYLAEPAGSPWHYRPGYDQLPIVKMTAFPRELSSPEYSICRSQTPEFGTMLELSGEATFMFPSISSTEGSPVRIEVLRDLESAWMESVPLFSGRSFGLPKNLAPLSYLSKTPEGLKETPKRCAKGLLRLATRSESELWRRRRSEPITGETDFGFWPTPTASNYGSNRGGAAGRTGKFRRSISSLIGGPENPEFREWLMGYNFGWTEIKPWVTRWFLSRRGKRLKD